MRPEVRRIAAADTIDLRHRVMWPELPRAAVMLDEDAAGQHFGAFDGDRLIAVASIFVTGTSARLRKLAVEPDRQGQGVASALLAAIMDALRADGMTELWCDARRDATGFYRRNGFVLESLVFQKRGRDYVVARRALRLPGSREHELSSPPPRD